MKTAMQELIDYFNERPEYDKTSEGYEIIQKAIELLEKEKEQIKDAFGTKKIEYVFNKLKKYESHSGYESYSLTNRLITGDEYYNQTYTQNK